MNKPIIELPKDHDVLGRIIHTHVETIRPYQQVWRASLMLATWYNMGYRRFKWSAGNEVRVIEEYLDEDSEYPYQDNRLLYDQQALVALLGQMDVKPFVRGRGTNLDMLRQRASAQVILDAVIRQQDLDEIERQVNWLLVSAGMVGLHTEIDQLPESGLYARTEVVNPVELLPFPSTGADITGTRGIIRRRYVPIQWLRERIQNPKKLKDAIKSGRANVRIQFHGEQIPSPNDMVEDFTLDGTAGSVLDSKGLMNLTLVDVCELYLLGPAGTVTRYVVTSGDQVLTDVSMDKEVYCPLQVARMHENGTFWGLGHFQMAFSAHRKAERMRARLFKNVEQLDKYGLLLVPTGTISDTAFQNVNQDNIRLLKWSPDPTTPTVPNPVQISPFNSGTLPLQVSEFANQLAREVTPIPKLEEEFPRMDSPSAFRFLDEKGRRNLTNVTNSKTRMYGQLYRAACQLASEAIVVTDAALPVGNLTLDLVGVKIDAKRDVVSFGQAQENLLPRVGLLDFTIRHSQPINKNLMVQEAMQALQIHQDMTRFYIHLCENDLPFPAFFGEEKAAYDKVVRTIITLVGNGSEVGTVFDQQAALLPELQVRVLTGFMVGPVFQMLDVQIQESLIQYKNRLMETLGRQLPPQLPTPEELMNVRGQ